jgi:hypothetical protein
MAQEIQGKVGPGYAADGSLVDPRMTKDLATVVQDAHGKYYEAVYRGTVFEAVTAAAGTTPGTSIGTTGAFTLYNPINSGKNLVVIDAAFGYVSGTLGSGTLYLVGNTNPSAAAVTGTAITPVNLLLGGAVGVGKAFTGSTLPATPTALSVLAILTEEVATTLNQYLLTRTVLDGKYIVAPGCALSFEAVTVSSSTPLAVFSMAWEEVAI